MFDFRLKVFHTVAKRLNFTRAAEELFITQPAVTKHIHELETYFKTQLFERKGNRISLTSAGKVLFTHVEELFGVYRKIEVGLAQANQEVRGAIRIGASTTISQYVLPRQLAQFRKNFPDIRPQLISGNTSEIEAALLERKIDVGLVEGQSKRQQLKYTEFAKDEIVLCTAINNRLSNSDTINLKKVVQLPLLLREQGSGSLEVISKALQYAGVSLSSLRVEMVLQSTESIKSYLLNSSCFAFLSIHAILNELQTKTLRIVDISNFAMERNFYFLRQQGDNNVLADLLFKFLVADNLR